MVTALIISLSFNIGFLMIVILAVIGWKEDQKKEFHFKSKRN